MKWNMYPLKVIFISSEFVRCCRVASLFDNGGIGITYVQKSWKRESGSFKNKNVYYPYLTYITIVGIVVILISMLFIESMRPQLILTVVLTAIIIGCYFVFVKKAKEQKHRNLDT